MSTTAKIAQGFARARATATAHGIRRVGLAHLEGAHLSAALNEPIPRIVGPSVYRDMAVERQVADMEALGGWIESMSSERQPSPFGPISTQDLIAKIIFNDMATDAQLVIACHELKDRYLTEHAADIAEEILRMQAADEQPEHRSERGELDAFAQRSNRG